MAYAPENFTLGGKAVVDEVTDSGNLILRGLAVNYEGIDRQGENFIDGAFSKAIDSFLSGSAPLVFHHKTAYVLGEVVSLQEIPGVGIEMVAAVDGAIKNDPRLSAIYSGIKEGYIAGLSVGGRFGRIETPRGPRINEVDLLEVSCTAVPVHPGTGFKVVAGKAVDLQGAGDALDRLAASLAISELRAMLAGQL